MADNAQRISRGPAPAKQHRRSAAAALIEALAISGGP